jgi:ribosome-associated toxin RatA of RatAB toxin-antitoxin module
MKQNLAEHHAAVTVNAPVHQVYSLFSHFNDFPKFMTFVKEVTYYDDQRSHWVADVAGNHEWDAVNEDWIPDRQIGWRSFSGLENYGRVIFQPVSEDQTRVDVYVNYNPPAGILGDIGEHMGAGKRFDDALQKDLNNFAKMVDLCPVNADDPNWSQYLFHPESAAAKGKTTARQNETMGGEYTPTGTDREYETMPGQFTASDREREYDTTPGQFGASDVARERATMSAQNVPGSEERPTLDRDIVSEPENRVPPGQRPAETRGNPNYPDAANREIPPEQIPPYPDRPEDYPNLP